MRISSSMRAPDLSNLPVDAQIDAELMAKEKQQLETDGAMTVQMIDSAMVTATPFENKPLNFGHVGRRINIAT
jgi:hypothetical protein